MLLAIFRKFAYYFCLVMLFYFVLCKLKENNQNKQTLYFKNKHEKVLT